MAKLCAYIINGSPINELDQYEKYQLNGNPPFVSEDIVPAGYQDISTINNWDKYGLATGYDYKYVRIQIYILVTTIGWTNLSIAEKTIASIWFVVVKSQRDEVHTLEEQKANGRTHHEKSRQNRYDRHTAALMDVYNRLEKADAQSVLKRLEDSNLLHLYIEYGIEGTASGDIEGIMDYVNSVAGTSFALNGLIEETYIPVEGTLTDLKVALNDIIINGNY